MSTVAQFSLAEYEHMASLGAFDGKFRRRVELIHGEIRDMSPIGAAHADFVDRLAEWSMAVVVGKPIRIRVQNPVRIPELESEPEPDVVWAKRRNYADRHPAPSDVLLLIEVSDSPLDFDRGEKLALYAESGVQEYWIVNLIDEQIEVYRNPSGRTYQDRALHRGAEAVSPVQFPEIEFRVAQVFGS